MRNDAPPRIAAPALGEAPPTAGLPPRWRDLLWPGRGPTFEAAICKRFGFDDIEIVSTATAGLLIAFTYLKEQSLARDVVIVPGYTCPLVVLAVAAAGLKAVACDTLPGRFDLDPTHLARLVDERTLAIVPTHYGGVLTDVEAVRRAAPGVPVVEDAAQAFGATSHGRNVGLTGDIGVFSFTAGKGLTIYLGGALVARDAATMAGLKRTAARLTRSAPLGEFGRLLMLAGYHAAYNPWGLRLFYGAGKRRACVRGDDIAAAGDRFSPDIEVTRVSAWRKRVGRAALPRLDAHLEGCRARFDKLAARLECIPGFVVHTPPPHARPSATSLFLTLQPHREREAFIQALWRSRLGVSRMFARAIGDYPDIAPLLQPSETPNARALAAHTITLTTSELSSAAAEDAIVATLEGFARSAGWNA